MTRASTSFRGWPRFTVGATDYDAPAGTLGMIPPGAPHTFANPTDDTTVVLNSFTPDLYVQYFRDLRDMIASGQALDADAVIAVMARYATEPADTSEARATSATRFGASSWR
jgi:oxalate decarboxylase/phosphoglucose isomerase-like protein (cupin superfamily)